MSIRLASHLYRNRHGMFYFRLIIPADLQGTVQKKELRFSLQTEERHHAKQSACHIICNKQNLFDELRTMRDTDTQPPPDYFSKWIASLKENLRLNERIDELEARVIDLTIELKSSVQRDEAKAVVEKAWTKGQLKGKQELEKALVFPWPPERTEYFSTLTDAYLKSLTHRAANGRRALPTDKTLDAYRKDIGSFIFVLGDMRIGKIDREIAGDFFSILRKLPANISRKKAYRGKAVSELIELGDPPQSEQNASKKMERISAMFLWALQEKRKWGIDANPFSGYGQVDNESKARRPFTREELIALFNHPNFTEKRFPNSYSYWMIPLAIFTGARLRELAQLELADFIESDGIPCIDINDEPTSDTEHATNAINPEDEQIKRIKTKNAKRLVPIHSELIRLGLLRHVDRLRSKGSKYLFPELNRNRRDGPGHAVSNWFQRFREKVGITNKQATVFHSFRHGFITTILDSGISPHTLAPVVGHESDLVTGKLYWNKKDASKRRPCIEAFSIDTEILKLIPTIDDVSIKRM